MNVTAEGRVTERAARESEERFRRLVALAADWYWEQDSEYRFTRIEGPDATPLEGFKQNIGKRRWEQENVDLTPEQWAAHRREVEAHRAFRDFELPIRDALGKRRWVSVSGEPMYDAAERFVGYRGTAKEITARKLAETELRRFRLALDSSIDSIYLTDLATMRFVDVNEVACRRLGYTRTQLLQMGPHDVLREDRAQLERDYRTLIDLGERGKISEVRYQRRDGTAGWTELHRRALRTDEGWLIVTIGRDITDRKRADEALRESEERFRNLVELSSDWYWEQDEHFRFVDTESGSAASPLRAAEVAYVGKTRWEVNAERLTAEQWAAHRRQLERHEEFHNFEYERLSRDGRMRWVSISGRPVFDADGRFRGYRGIGRDVTAQKRNEQLRALELAVTRLFSERSEAAGALKAALRAICYSERWDCGRYLWVDRAANLLRFGEGWNVAEPNIERYMEDSRRAVYAPGFGIAGSVWQSQQPQWVPDMTADPRVARPALARATGMRGTFAVPVSTEGRTVGVLIFHSHEIREPDRQLLDTLRVVGGQIALFLQRSQAEAELRRFRMAMDNSADMILLVDRETMRFVDVNRTMCEALGYSREELLALRPEDLLPSIGRPELEAAYDRQIANPSVPGGMRSYYRRKDGSPLPFESKRQVLRTGDRWLISVVARDISERIQAEEALREREAQLRLVTDSLPAMVCYLGPDCRYRYANLRYREFYAGSTDPIEGKLLADVLGASAWEAVRGKIERALDGEATEYTRKHRRASDGSRRELDVSLVPHRDPAGRVLGLYVMVLDVTRRRRAESALHLRNRAIEQSVNAIVITQSVEAKQRIVYVNPAFERMTGYSSAEVVGKNPAFLHRHDRAQAAVEALRTAERDKREMTVLIRNFRKDDTPFWSELRVAPVRDEDGRVTHYIGVSNDVTERIRYQEEIERNANYDTLTGLPNRNLLNDRIGQTIVQAARAGHTLAVAFVDLDHLKRINDSLGHEMGDRVIAATGRRIAETLRTGDTVARVSGDEFVIVLGDLQREDDAAHVAGKVLNCIGTPLKLDGHEFVLTASIGIALYPKDGQDAPTLLRNADAALYRAKEQGRDCFRFFAPEMNLRAVEFLALEQDLRRALEEREFRLQYQPIVNIVTGEAVGAEALLRWRRADGSVVQPGQFIPVAEESGLIVPIGRWVLQAAARQAGEWNRGRRTPFYVTINLSARQFRDPGLLEAVRAATKGAGVDPELIKLEITESTVMENPEDAARLLDSLKALGIKLSVDDFGTGYSSLSYLKRFPIDTLKIDRTFVRDLAVDRDDLAICDAVIGLGRGLELEVIAEGVETREQAEALLAHGCRLAQGFLYGRPADPEALQLPAAVPTSSRKKAGHDIH